MSEPLGVVRLKHADLELWPDCVVSVFRSDGLDVTAAPNGMETIVMTACHEASHHILSQIMHDRPSVCLRAVAEGDGHRWTDERRAEEDLAYPMGLILSVFVMEMIRAYGPRYLAGADGTN